MFIKFKQIEEFKRVALAQFEEEVVMHIREFFPNHYLSIKEKAVRNTITYGRLNARKYGFTTKRNVCLYINSMFVLGSNFDTDPQYPWAADILNDKSMKDPKHRIDSLSDKMLDVFGQIRGPLYIDINRALLNLHNNAADLFEKLANSQLKDALPFLKDLYPKKFEVIGKTNLNRLITLVKQKAAAYGIFSEPNVLMFVSFMFLSGAGFDKDPQFAWAAEVLNSNRIMDENQRSKTLYDEAIDNLRGFLKQYKS